MTQMHAPGQHPATCPWCETHLLPLAATEKSPAGAYCPRCPWHSRAAGSALPRKQRKPENLRPPIQAAAHLAQRQRERDRWRETEPVTYRERSGNAQQPADDTAWTTTDLVLMGAAVVFIVAALAIKHWPL